MITLLMWRCPLCASNDALIEKRKMFRPIELHCQSCKTTWLERREVGMDSWFRVIKSPSYPDQVGVERKSAEWYAQLKSNLALTPIEAALIPLEEGEQLYLISKRVELTAKADNPHFFEMDQDTSPEDLRAISRKVGRGRVFLTNRRLVWKSEQGQEVSLPLTRMNSLYALRNKTLILLYEMHMFSLVFFEESLLKWLTYFSKVAEDVQQNSGHTITTSRF